MLHIMSFPVLIVVYPSEDSGVRPFTAHCLNMDIVADGESARDAIARLFELIEVTVEAAEQYNANPFDKAPRKYWDMAAKAKRLPRELIDQLIVEAGRRLHGTGPLPAPEKYDVRELVPG